MKENTYKKPVIYQQRKHFLDCVEYLICSYITSYGYNYHWLLYDSLGFYFNSKTNQIFSENNTSKKKFYENLERMFGVEIRNYSKDSTDQLIRKVIDSGSCLFIAGNGFYLPWVSNYQRNSNVHYFMLTNYSDDDKVFVIDYVPEFKGWIRTTQIIASMKEVSFPSDCIELSIPSLSTEIEEILSAELNEFHIGIIGKEVESINISSGLFAIKNFLQALYNLNDEGVEFLETWSLSLKSIIDSKCSFLEFIYFMKNDLNYSINPVVFSTIDQTINSWESFRICLLKSKITGKYDAKKNIERLSRVYNMELECADVLKKFL
ncbi:hypothetical protein BSK49_10775 [Paenibacillus odorifer]|uniref:hypothetical protein n=1 Tax=Paenibacillus TaxID=44249 RepID=UPI00096D3C91|nr:hypothetical protein [Paenibacillus odorifer]OMD89842.1 hypothetical protein BSK49_10775 [Paenibacillus odorifer]OMD95829.1 hypothetical protein BSK64_29465 [Paenibacillus odorifer]